MKQELLSFSYKIGNFIPMKNKAKIIIQDNDIYLEVNGQKIDNIKISSCNIERGINRQSPYWNTRYSHTDIIKFEAYFNEPDLKTNIKYLPEEILK
jgi:hypothetical protein